MSRIQRYAERLVDAARSDNLHARRRELEQHMTQSPRMMLELVETLALLVVERRPRYGPSLDTTEHRNYLRLAHAAYNRGERFDWVVEGEREYQRDKARRYRRRLRRHREAA